MHIAVFIINYESMYIITVLNPNNFPSLLQRHLFSDDVFTSVRAGQPVTHRRSTNSKPQPSIKFPMDEIQSRPTWFHLDICHKSQ